MNFCTFGSCSFVLWQFFLTFVRSNYVELLQILMVKKALFSLFVAAVSTLTALCQQEEMSLRFDARADFNYYADKNNSQSGFSGKNLNLMLDGKINSKLEYHLRQRLNVPISTRDMFDATDWIYLKYDIDENFFVSAGKQVVAIGTFEYDYAPIDCYFLSDFCNNIPCYELGINFGFRDNSGRNTLQFQVANSPFAESTLGSLYSYNLLWNGNFDWFKTIYSLNMIEQRKGDFINYIALGNQFSFDRFVLELDYINRYHENQESVFDDFSLIANLKASIGDKWRVFVKGGYDMNKAQTPVPTNDSYPWDYCVSPGTEYGFYGAGCEFFPLKGKNDVRLHAYLYSNNQTPSKVFFNMGLTWKMQAINR